MKVLQDGLVVIKFSERMVVVPDLQMITNGTVAIDGITVPVFDVEVIPSNDTDPDNLSFDSNVTAMTNTEFQVQIYFDQAIKVSQNYQADRVRFNFVDRYLFVSENFRLLDVKDAAGLRRLSLRADRNKHMDLSSEKL